MKKNFSTRLLSIFLAILMIVTTVPAFTLAEPVEAKADIHAKNDNKYVFAYFTGDGEGQKVRLAISSDGHSFAPLNGNQPFLRNDPSAVYPSGSLNSVFPASGYARDPFIFEKVDGTGHWIVATDLQVVGDGRNNDYNNTKMLVWDVSNEYNPSQGKYDLAHANEIQPWNVEGAQLFANTYNGYNDNTKKGFISWAPEVTYDHNKNMYVLYWSGPHYDDSSIRCAYTNDFKTFYKANGTQITGASGAEPDQLFAYSDQRVIDANIVHDHDNNMYYMVYKCEYSGSSNNKQNIGTLWITKASTIQGLTGTTPRQINLNQGENSLVFEGPELYQRNDGRWVLITDQYSKNPFWDYYMLEADNLDDFYTNNNVNYIDRRDSSTNINDCLPRHGAVTQISAEQYYSLAYNAAIPSSFPISTKDKIFKFDSTNDQWNSVPASDKSNYVSNVLWLTDSSTDSKGFISGTSNTHAFNTDYGGGFIKTGQQKAHFSVEYPKETVVRYDGVDTVRIPIMCWCHRAEKWSNNDKAVYFYQIYPTNGSSSTADNTEIGIVNKWRGGKHGSTDIKTSDYIYALLNGDNYIGNNAATTGLSNSCSNSTGNGANYQHYSSQIYIKNTINFNGSYVKTITNTPWVAYACMNTTPNKDHEGRINDDKNVIRVLDYSKIYSAVDTIRATFQRVMQNGPEGLSVYCPESLDSYLAAVAKTTADLNLYFERGNYYEEAAKHLEDVCENGKLALAKAGPTKARIQYGNLFDFDAYLASGSVTYVKNDKVVYETNDGTHCSYDRGDKVSIIRGYADSYNSHKLLVDTYTIPVEPGQTYIFEYSVIPKNELVSKYNLIEEGHMFQSDLAQYDTTKADAMVFIPNAANTGYEQNWTQDGQNIINAWRPHGNGVSTTDGTVGGTKKVVVKIPTEAQIGRKINYVWFRLGVQGASTSNPATVAFNRVRFYKAEYENWASKDLDSLKKAVTLDDINTKNVIGFTEYGQALATPSKLAEKHFCGWVKDEADLTKTYTELNNAGKIIRSSDQCSSCTVLYAKYSDAPEVTSTAVAATCLDAGHTADRVCEECGQVAYAGVDTAKIAHHFRHDVTGVHDFVCDDCTAKNEQTPLNTDFVNYDALDQVYNTLDMNKYTAAGKDAITSKYNEYKAVLNNGYEYTQADINTAKAKAQTDVDTAVANLLNTINTCNTTEKDSKVNKFNTSFEVLLNKNTPVSVDPDVAEQTHFYGDTVTLSAPEGCTAVKWSVAKYADGELTSTYTVYGRDSIDIIADTNNVVTLVVTKEKEEVQASQMVKVINSLGRVFSVQYGDIVINGTTLKIGGTEVEAPQIPFYTFTGWTQMKDDETGAKRVKAVYSIDDTQPIITLTQGTLQGRGVIESNGSSYKVYYDKSVIIDGSDITNFYAWAVKDGDKYQVVSYSARYDFNPVVNETYVPILKSGNSFTVEGAAVTASNIACEAINAMTADQSVVFKLQNKLPFVYIQATKMLDGNTKARVYGRYTEGATTDAQIINYGVIYGTGTKTSAECVVENVGTSVKVYNASLTNAIGSGQFMYTLIKSNGGTFAREVSYNAYINYSYNYKDSKNQDDHFINTREYSGVKTANLT